ncbi:dihydroflavonol-4-reductase [Ceratobasidium sp. AG-I]|nr:dihydroflavonol-4-reductase [Ceratobasidium sp. AG-I]
MVNVLLTGGNGFIAVHILCILLDRGYSVTTTVRAESKANFLRSKFASAVSNGQLKFAIIEDITVSGAFDEVFKSNSFEVVLHTSSPFVLTVTDIEKDLLKPAIEGTTEILKSTKKYGSSVKRVVITSSFAAIRDASKGNRPGYAYSEKDWNPVTYDGAQKDPGTGYDASKKLAEKAAWDFMENEKPGFDLVTLCPPIVYGPVIQEVKDLKKLNTSSAPFYNIFSGQVKELGQVPSWIWVDVRDLAEAHIAAFEKPQASNQRFFTTEGTFNMGQVSDFIWKYYPERAQAKGIPKSTPEDGYPWDGNYHADNSKSKEVLGLKYTPSETMLKDTLEQFVVLEKELGVQ